MTLNYTSDLYEPAKKDCKIDWCEFFSALKDGKEFK